jgi:hypothetical protein
VATKQLFESRNRTYKSYFCPTPRKGINWQKLGCYARPSEDQTPEAGIFGAARSLLFALPIGFLTFSRGMGTFSRDAITAGALGFLLIKED